MFLSDLFQVSNFLQRVRSSQTAMSRKKKRKNYVTSSVVVETDYISVEELELVSLLCLRECMCMFDVYYKPMLLCAER